MPEVAYSQKHSKLRDAGDSFSQTLAADFLSVPVLFKFGAQEGGFYVLAGPGFNFRTKIEAKDTEIDGEPFPEFDEDLEDETESFDFSLIAGLGWARGNFGFEGRYDHGLSNLNKDDEEDLEMTLVKISDLPALLDSGQITHALVSGPLETYLRRAIRKV